MFRSVNLALATRTAAAFFVLWVIGAPSNALAQTSQADEVLTVEVNTGDLVRLSGSAAQVFVADPEVADVQVPNSRSVFVLGLKAGQTTLYALASNGSLLLRRDVQVVHNVTRMKEMIDQALPDNNVVVESMPTGLLITGAVSDAASADQIMLIAQTFVSEEDEIVNQLEVAAPTQVNLRVRVAEVQRSVHEPLGFNWDALFEFGNFALGLTTGRVAGSPGNILGAAGVTGSPLNTYSGNYSNSDVNVTAVIDALSEEGLITVLAEPNLTALTGETANFLAGGEFPVPVAQNDDRVSIEFKEFGISLDFTPTVLSSDRISMRVRPEVSELTDTGAIRLRDFVIPGLQVRRAETTVELASGQSFAIGGLLQDTSRTNVSKIPGLGDIPILGALFNSSRYQKGETELVIIVTPYVVRPTSSKNIATPLDGFRPATDLERIFLNRVAKNGPAQGSTGPTAGVNGVRLVGPAGFFY